MHEPIEGHAVANRSVMITHEAWAAVSERAFLEKKTINDLCVALLAQYLSQAEPPVYHLSKSPRREKTAHTLYTSDELWSQAHRLKGLQGRTISAILEQLIRAYTGLEVGEPEIRKIK